MSILKLMFQCLFYPRFSMPKFIKAKESILIFYRISSHTVNLTIKPLISLLVLVKHFTFNETATVLAISLLLKGQFQV